MKTLTPTALGAAAILSAFVVPAAANTGVASYYGAELAGRKTANGERFNPNALTAAHRSLPFGTMLRLTNLSNGHQVVVRINDRGPFVGGRVLDVSHGAARVLGMTGSGTARLRIEALTGRQVAEVDLTPGTTRKAPSTKGAQATSESTGETDWAAQRREETMSKV